MILSVWAMMERQSLERFEKWYQEREEENPELFLHEMDVGAWQEQYLAFMDSTKGK